MQMQVYLTKPFFSLLFFLVHNNNFGLVHQGIVEWFYFGGFCFCFCFFASRPVVQELNLVLSVQCTVSVNGL